MSLAEHLLFLVFVHIFRLLPFLKLARAHRRLLQRYFSRDFL